MSMKEALENYFARLESSCQNITGEYNIYCSNCIGIGLQNMWDVWETAPYIRKLDGAANGCTYWGVPSAIQTLTDYMEQYGFKRAFTEGSANVKAGKYISIGLGNVWDPWNDSPYINKISNMGDIGVVNKTISDQEIIDWCGWELED